MLLKPEPYDPRWIDRFEDYRQMLAKAGDGTWQIAHIGSTAVPGLAAKPIIDIQIGVPSLIDFQTRALNTTCFVLDPSITADDPPPGLSGNPADWRKRYARHTQEGIRRAHLHIREIGRPNHRFALLMRDFLRNNDLVRDQYGAFKLEIAQLAGPQSEPGGTGAYLDLKDPFVRLIGLMAEDWAKRTDWSAGWSGADTIA